MKIIISARVAVSSQGTNELLEGASLRPLDGIKYDQDGCANYLGNALAEIGLTEGFLSLEFEDKSGHLRVVTEFISPRKLKPAELKKLASEVDGQWSDGIGEGCFDELAKKHKVTIDLTPTGVDRDLRTEQVDDEKQDDAAAKATRKLLTAISKGDLKKAREAVDAGADIEAKRQGFSVLDKAVGNSQVEIVKFLLQKGANPNCKNIIGGCPLTSCATNRTVTDEIGAQMAAILIAHGANVNLESRGDGDTPLYYAINRDKKLLQKTLREHGGKSKRDAR